MPISIKPLFDKIMNDPDIIPEEGTEKKDLALGIAIQRAKQSINNSVALNMAKQITAVSRFSDWTLLQKAKDDDKTIFGTPAGEDMGWEEIPKGQEPWRKGGKDDDTDPASPNYKAPNTHVWEGHPVMEGGGGVREGDVGKSIIAVQMTPAVVTRHKAATGRAKDAIRKESQRNAEKHFTDWFRKEFGREPISSETPIFSAHEDRGVSTANWPWRGVKAADLKGTTDADEQPIRRHTGESDFPSPDDKSLAKVGEPSNVMGKAGKVAHTATGTDDNPVHYVLTEHEDGGGSFSMVNALTGETIPTSVKYFPTGRAGGFEKATKEYNELLTHDESETSLEGYTPETAPETSTEDEGAAEATPTSSRGYTINGGDTPTGGDIKVGGSTKPRGAQELTSDEWIATKPKRLAGGKKGTVTFAIDSHLPIGKYPSGHYYQPDPEKAREEKANQVTVKIPTDAGGYALTLKDNLAELQKLAHRKIIADTIAGDRGAMAQTNISAQAVTEHGLQEEHDEYKGRQDAALEGMRAVQNTKDGKFTLPKGTDENSKAIGGGPKAKTVTAKNYKGTSVFKIPSGKYEGQYAIVATNRPSLVFGSKSSADLAYHAAHVVTSLGGNIDFTKLDKDTSLTEGQTTRLQGALKTISTNPYGDYSKHVHQYDAPTVGTVRTASSFDTEGIPEGEHARIGGEHEYRLKDVQVRGGKSIEHWAEDVPDAMEEEEGAVVRDDDEDYDPDVASEREAQRIEDVDYEAEVGTQKGLTRIVNLNTGKAEHHVEHADLDDADLVHQTHTIPDIQSLSPEDRPETGDGYEMEGVSSEASSANLRPEERVGAISAATIKDEIQSIGDNEENLDTYTRAGIQDSTIQTNRNRYNQEFYGKPVKAARSLTDILQLSDKDLIAHLDSANPAIDTRKITEGHMRTSDKGVHLAPTAAIRMRQELARAVGIKTKEDKLPSANDVKEAIAAESSVEYEGSKVSERHDALDKAQELRDILVNHTLLDEGTDGERTPWRISDFKSKDMPAGLREALPDWISQNAEQTQVMWDRFREMATNITARQGSSEEVGETPTTDAEVLSELKAQISNGSDFIQMMGKDWGELVMHPSQLEDADQHEAGHPLHDSRWRKSTNVQDDQAAYRRSAIMSLNARVERYNESNPNFRVKTPVEIMNDLLADPDKWHEDNHPPSNLLGKSSGYRGRQSEWQSNFNVAALSKYLLGHNSFKDFVDKMEADDPSLHGTLWDEDDQYHETYQSEFTEELMAAGKDMISDLGGVGQPKNWLEGLSAKWQGYREKNYDDLYPAGDPFTEDEDLSEFDRLSKTRKYPADSPLAGKFIKIGNTEVDRRLEASHDAYADHAMAFLTNRLMDEWTWKDKAGKPIIDPETERARRGLNLDSSQQAALSDEDKQSLTEQRSNFNDYKNNFLGATEGFQVAGGMQSFFDSGSFEDALKAKAARVEKRQELAAPLDELQERIHREKAGGRHGRVTVVRPPSPENMPRSLRDKITEISKDTTDRGERDKRIKDALEGDEWYKGVVENDGFTKDHKTKFIEDVMAHSHGIANDTEASTGRGYTIDGGTAVEQLAEHTGIDADKHPNKATAESDTDSAVDKLAKKLARDGVVANNKRGVDNAGKLLNDHKLTEKQIRDFHGTLEGKPITGGSFGTNKFKEFMDNLNTDKKVTVTEDVLDEANKNVTPNDIQVGRSDGVADKLKAAKLDPNAEEHAHILTHDQADALINKHKAEADKAAAEAAEPQSDTEIDSETGDHKEGDQLEFGGFGSHEEAKDAQTSTKEKLDDKKKEQEAIQGTLDSLLVDQETNDNTIDEAQKKIADAETEINEIKTQNGDEIPSDAAARIKELEEQSAADKEAVKQAHKERGTARGQHTKLTKDVETLKAEIHALNEAARQATEGVEDLDEHIRDQVKYLTEHMDSHIYEEKDLKALARHNPTKLFSVWDKTKEKVGKEPTAEGKKQKQDKIDDIGRHVHGKEEYDNMSEDEKEAWRKPMHNKSLSEIDKELNTHTSSTNNNIINERRNSASQAQATKDEGATFRANSVSALLGDIPEGIGKKDATDMYREIMQHLVKHGAKMEKSLANKLAAQGQVLVDKHGADTAKVHDEITQHYNDLEEDAEQHVHTDEEGNTIDDGYIGSDAHKTDVDAHGAEMEKQDAYDDLISGNGGLAARMHAHEEGGANVSVRVDERGRATHSTHSHAGYEHDAKRGGRHKEIDEKKLRNKLGIEDYEAKGAYGHHDGDVHHDRERRKDTPAQVGHGWHEDYHTDEQKAQLSGHLDTHRKLTSEMGEAYRNFSADVRGEFEGSEEDRRAAFVGGKVAQGIKQRMAQNTRAASRKAGKGKGEKVDLEGVVQSQGGHDGDSEVEGEGQNGAMSDWAKEELRRERNQAPGPAPRPGLEWNPDNKHWMLPEKIREMQAGLGAGEAHLVTPADFDNMLGHEGGMAAGAANGGHQGNHLVTATGVHSVGELPTDGSRATIRGTDAGSGGMTLRQASLGHSLQQSGHTSIDPKTGKHNHGTSGKISMDDLKGSGLGESSVHAAGKPVTTQDTPYSSEVARLASEGAPTGSPLQRFQSSHDSQYKPKRGSALGKLGGAIRHPLQSLGRAKAVQDWLGEYGSSDPTTRSKAQRRGQQSARDALLSGLPSSKGAKRRRQARQALQDKLKEHKTNANLVRDMASEIQSQGFSEEELKTLLGK